jgi:hypothetical protein
VSRSRVASYSNGVLYYGTTNAPQPPASQPAQGRTSKPRSRLSKTLTNHTQHHTETHKTIFNDIETPTTCCSRASTTSCPQVGVPSQHGIILLVLVVVVVVKNSSCWDIDIFRICLFDSILGNEMGRSSQ